MSVNGLTHLRRNTFFAFKRYDDALSLADCIVTRPKHFRIEILEPLPVSAPGPKQAQAYCCYIQTVKFYKLPLHSDDGGEFALWGECETRLRWDDLVLFRGDVFQIGGGSVEWRDGKWWMRRHARIVDDETAERTLLDRCPPQTHAEGETK